MELFEKDIEKLELIQKYVSEGTACTLHKRDVLASLDAVLNPKCAVCRGIIEGDVVVKNNRKMHPKCEKRYKN